MLGRLVAFVIAILLVLPVGAQDITGAFLGQVNAARAEVGVGPLTPNAQLAAAAQLHSSDMADGDFLSHTGSDGSQFWDRMRQNSYAMTTGAENVLYRWDTDANGAFQQWYGSEGHRLNMLNPDYTEVGVAYAVASDGKHYYTMVLGTRPGIDPQPVQQGLPTATLSQQTETEIRPAQSPPAVTMVADIPAPSSPTVGYTDSVVLPIQPTVASRALQPTGVVPTMMVLPATPTPVAVQPAPVLQPPTPSTSGAVKDLRLLWDMNSFAIVNISGGSLNMAGLRFNSVGGSLNAVDWQTDYLSAPLSAFPADDCLQVWGIGQSFITPKPTGCNFRHAWIVVGPERLFWRDAAEFSVSNNGAVVAVCNTGTGRCDVDLSQSFTGQVPLGGDATVPTPAVTTGPSANIRLIYDAQSLTILNTSSGPVNLAELSLQSERGNLSISQWDNGFLSASLGRFPGSDCLQVWNVNTEFQPKPAACSTRHAWISVGSTSTMWVNVPEFAVFHRGQQIAVCHTDAGTCNIEVR